MAYTTISELTLNGDGSIVFDGAFFQQDVAFFYLKDIQKVLQQGGSDAKLSQLCIINIKFEKNDGPGNHNRHDVTGLALAKSELRFDGAGKIINTDWHETVALAWPPYYIKDSVTTLENDDSLSEFFGHLFEGSSEYIPGLLPLKKNKKIE